MKRLLHKMDHDWRRSAFRWRQFELVAGAAIMAGGFALHRYQWALAVAVLMVQTATDEALRYRRTGHNHQTKRSIVRGSCPIDKACQQKLPRDCWDYRRQAC